MSVVRAKSVCLYFPVFIRFEIAFFADSRIMKFGHPGHQVIVSFVDRFFVSIFYFDLVNVKSKQDFVLHVTLIIIIFCFMSVTLTFIESVT